VMKIADFLGVKKFGEGLAGTAQYIGGEASNAISNATGGKVTLDKTYKELTDKMNDGTATPEQIDAFKKMTGADLSAKEVVGSAAMTGLNILSGGTLKGAKVLSSGQKILRGAELGGAYGSASAMADDKGIGEIITQGATGALAGGAMSGVGVLASKAKSAIAKGGQDIAERTMNSAVKPSIQETEKVIERGGKTLGRELIERDIKGGSKKLFQIAKEQLNENGKQLNQVLKEKHADKVITRQDIVREFKSMLTDKMGTPTLSAKRDIEKIREAFTLIPQKMNVYEANEMKRKLYKELGSKAYKLDPNLSTEGEISEKIAEALRKNIENKTGDVSVKLLNKELSIFKQLKDAARGNIARTSRNQVAGVGTIGATIEKVIGAVPIKTRAAVSVDKLSKALGNIKADSAGKISKSALLNILNNL